MMDTMNVVTVLAIVFLIFLICREIVCWYFKLNKISETLIEVRDLMNNMEAKANVTKESP